MAYVPRLVDSTLTERLSPIGAVVLDGPKACGKTQTARQACRSEVLLDVDENARQAALVDPALLLDGETPRLIDEWQVVPQVWNHVRRAVDDRRAPGQFVLTGSATPADDHARHSGAGRFGRVRMRPLTLTELGRSSATVSLASLLEGGGTRTGDPRLSLDDLIDEVLRGGWPDLLGANVAQAGRWLREYLDRIRRVDVRALNDKRHDPERVGTLLRSVARHVAQAPSMRTLVRDMASDESGASIDAVRAYLDALRRLMILDDVPAWNVHLRSSHQLRQRPTMHLADPSLAAAAMRASAGSLRQDLSTLGLLFESLVVRDLRVYAGLLDGDVYHYRDESGLEVDAIVEVGDVWGAFEIKLGPGLVGDAAATLAAFRDRVDTTRRGEPALLGVVVGSGYGYVRPDGVHVIPIGALTA